MVRWCWLNFKYRGDLLICIKIGQGPIALAAGADGVVWTFFSSPLAGKRGIVVTRFVRCMCVRPSVPPPGFVRTIMYNYSWISKQFGTGVALDEEKCHLKQFVR